MKKTLALTALALLSLTGCTQEQQSAEPKPTETTTQSHSERATESPSGAVSSQSSEPVVSPTLARGEEFEGVTLKGNDLYFAFLNGSQQEYMNNLAGSDFSWGVLCSTSASVEQLNETGVSVVDPDGDNSVLRSVQKASVETVAVDSGVEAGFSALIGAASYPDTSGKTCVGVVSDDGLVAGRSYEKVSEGQYVGSVDLVDVAELPRK